METLPTLSYAQYALVYGAFWAAVAIFLLSFAGFLVGQGRTAAGRYRLVVLLAAGIVGLAAYHYVRLAESWAAAYALSPGGGLAVPTGRPFYDAYRYADWLLTVPLLLVQWALLLEMPARRRAALLARLVAAALLMLVLGYVGAQHEAATLFSERALWGLLSSIPFAYVLYVLWGELGGELREEPPAVAGRLRAARWLLLATWGFYPLAYLLPMLAPGLGPGNEVALQASYTAADVLAKAGYGAVLYAVARAKTEAARPAHATGARNAATGAPAPPR